MKKKLLGMQILKRIANIPTASFYEDLMVKELFDIFREMFEFKNKVNWHQDSYGNVHLNYRGGVPNSLHVIYVVHMDHPAFHLELLEGKVIAEMAGCFNSEWIVGSRVKLYSNFNEVAKGKIISKFPDNSGKNRSLYVVEPDVIIDKDLCFAMLDLGDLEVKDGFIRASVLDDYASIAMTIAAFQQIIQNNEAINVSVVFHKAEEVGFIGAYTVASNDMYPKNALVYSIETSSRLARRNPKDALIEIAQLGKGIIIRTGDKMTPAYNMDAVMLAHLSALKHRIQVQELRMYGGSCEATLYCALGYRAAGLCLALNGWHNGLLDGEGTVCKEEVSQRDFETGIDLMVAMATQLANEPIMYDLVNGFDITPSHDELIKDIRDYFEDYRKRGFI